MSGASRIALVVGASGGIGGETALALSRHGWKIRAFSRTTSPSSGSPKWEWVKGDALHRTIRADHPLREPVVPRLWAQEIAKAHNQRAHPLPRGIFESFFQLDANSSLVRRRILRRLLPQDRERVGAIVIDRTREQYPRAAGLRCSDCVVNHGQDQFGPVPVTGRVHGVHDDVHPR